MHPQSKDTTYMTTINTDQVLKYGVHTTTLGAITAEGIAYLVQYGYAQSLQDSVAGVKKRVAEVTDDKELLAMAKEHQLFPTEADNAASLELDRAAFIESLAVAVANDRQAARLASIIDGTVGTARVGAARLSPMEKMAKVIAIETLHDNAAKTKKSLPKIGSDEFNSLVKQVLAKYAKPIEAEATKRLAAASRLGIDLST